jgi:ELWxxDGT repeat protein
VGTVLVKDIRAGSGGSTPTEFVALGSQVIFAANTDAESKEPWVSDGTEGGTLMLKDIREGSDPSFPNSFTRVGDAVFFGIQMDANDYELWKTDGTPDGTVRVKNVRIGDPGFELDGKLLFAGSDNEAITATELWISDGTPSGTRLVKNIAPDLGSSSPDHLIAVGDSVYFGALEGIEGSKAERIYSLWKSGGFHSDSERMTRLTSERFPGDLFEIANLNDTYAIFSGRIETETGFELGISDGTPEGTRILKDLRPGPGSSAPSYFVSYNNHVYFSNNFRLWRTDGTEGGTLELEPSISPFPTVALGDLYFQGRGQGGSGGQLWRAGTGLDTAEEVAVINPGAFAQINSITEFQGALYFSATDQGVNNVERELWTSDGISSASEVKDIRPGPEGSNPVNLVVAGDFLYFSADDGISGYELWKSDGTESGTVLLKDIRPGPESSNIRSSSLIEFNGEIYFVADDGTSGVELWKSDGTAAGTRLLKDIYPGPHSSIVPYEWQPVEFEGLLYFSAACPDYGYELWQTDGTPEGTRLAFDVLPGPASSVPEQLTVAGGRLHFNAFSPQFGNELHVYDPDFVDVPIELRLEGNQVLLEWSPAPERNLQLEESGSGSVWMTVSTPPRVSGPVHSVSLPATDGPRYFRLVEP